LIYEFGGAAAHAGLMTLGLPGVGGRVTPEQIRALAPVGPKTIDQAPSLLVLEDTHNSSGGRVWPLDELESVVAAAREVGLAVHLDGARLFNAAVAQGVAPVSIAAGFDTVTVCLSKGLGCPLGAVLAGSGELMERAWREKHVFGGAMRQAGIVAAAGLYALDHHVERLADDHARARRLADAWQAAGLPVQPERVETNFVQIDFAGLDLVRTEAIVRLREAGVGVSETIHPTVARAVTHLDVSDEDIERACELVPEALLAAASA
jgi:threonine aldolase